MSGSTEVVINTNRVEAQISATGIDVSLSSGTLSEVIIGAAGPQGSPGIGGSDGADGAPGPKGDTGAGMPIGGAAGQVPVKQSATDFDLTWSTSFTMDLTTGYAGAGTGTPQGPIHAKGVDTAIVLENSLSDGRVFTIAPGRQGQYGKDVLIFSEGNSLNGNTHLLRLQGGNIGVPIGNSFKGANGDITKYVPWTGSEAYFRFTGGAVSAKMRFEGWYYDGSGYGSSASREVMTLLNTATGVKVGIGKTNPVTTFDVNGPARVGSYTVATVPSASGVAGAMIFVSDEVGGAVIAFSDGTNWRRITDRAVIA